MNLNIVNLWYTRTIFPINKQGHRLNGRTQNLLGASSNRNRDVAYDRKLQPIFTVSVAGFYWIISRTDVIYWLKKLNVCPFSAFLFLPVALNQTIYLLETNNTVGMDLAQENHNGARNYFLVIFYSPNVNNGRQTKNTKTDLPDVCGEQAQI